jgi:pyridoxine/pyridoxamine 5'-phosphate oxidase
MGKADTPISKAELFGFLDEHRLAVVSTCDARGKPQSALIYVVPTEDLELIFYTLQTARKCENLQRDGRVSFVIGWPQEHDRTADQNSVQYEGIAEEQLGAARDKAKKRYLAGLPENSGMANWPGLTFFRVRPAWIRYSSYGKPWRVEEMKFDCEPTRAPRRWRH